MSNYILVIDYNLILKPNILLMVALQPNTEIQYLNVTYLCDINIFAITYSPKT